jgi:hypothetical protein
MPKLLGFTALLAVFILTLAASPVSAATKDVSVSMSFTEPFHQDINSGCPVIADGFCGNGVVVPYGHATESIIFGGACGGFCDLRTVNVAGGSIYIHEFFGTGFCPGSCQPNPAEPGGGTLNDVVVGGTGIFAGATGNLSGRVFAAGPPWAFQSAIKLSGTITLQT